MTCEKRETSRVNQKESVSIQILSSSLDEAVAPVVVDSETLDISSGGLKIYVDQWIENGCILDFCVEFSNNPRRFLLTGETKWCKKIPGENTTFYLGIEVMDTEGTDFAPWHKLFIGK
ncbi:MAG: PilZ domain-containing protein [Pseudomonadota bacterium]